MKTINTQECPDCWNGIIVEGAYDAWGCDAFEKLCPKCKGSGKIII
jgi:DnaJ-class molecular chaperone